MNGFLNHTLVTVAAGSAVLGGFSGALGCFAVLRRQSLLGDAISHAALPGIVLAFMFTGSKSPLVLLVGAAIAGVLATLLVISIVSTTRIKDDAALGIVLSVFFGIGLVLLSVVERRPQAAQAGLNTFLFGQAAALLRRDVLTLMGIAVVALSIVALFWKEFKLLSFDRDFGASIGYPMRFLDVFLTCLLTAAIVLGLQTVGVVLMSAMVVAPAAAARQWTNRLGIMVFLSVAFGAVSGIAGAGISSSMSKMPTGPTIVVCITVIVIFSLTLAPQRGMIWSSLQQLRNRRRLRTSSVLVDLYELELQHVPGLPHGHTPAAIRAMSYGQGGVEPSLERLAQQGLAYEIRAGRWALTQSGLDSARQVAESGKL